MNKKKCGVSCMVVSLVAIAGTSSAETLLGKNYVGGAAGMLKFGDDELDDAFGEGKTADLLGNINLTPNIDLQLGAGYLWADGETAGIDYDITGTALDADIVYFFNPDQKVNPYIGAGITHLKVEFEGSGYGISGDYDDTETGFGCEAGVEIEVTKRVLVNVGLDYLYFDDDDIDDNDSVDLNTGVGYWFTDQIMGGVSTSYDFDSDDTAASVGLIFKL